MQNIQFIDLQGTKKITENIMEKVWNIFEIEDDRWNTKECLQAYSKHISVYLCV